MTSPEAVMSANQNELQNLSKTRIEPHPTRAASISFAQAREVLKKLKDHPVAAPSQVHHYDPENRFGLCFGRALYVHLELLRRGVQKEAIKKVFAVGPMKATQVDWQFHVATAVMGPGQTWWVIDAALPEPVRLEFWWRALWSLSTDQKLRLYVTEPNRIGPSGWRYNVQPNGLRSYNGYFEDLFKYYKENPLPPTEKFSSLITKSRRQSGPAPSSQGGAKLPNSPDLSRQIPLDFLRLNLDLSPR